MTGQHPDEIAVLGGGCFWCLEAVFEQVRGVQAVTSGYSGGHLSAPTYDDICKGSSGHAEVVQLRFDPAVVSYRELLEVFFVIHDPTTPNRQGNDVGPQYRSVIFWHSDAQRLAAQTMMESLQREGVFSAPIVTELVPAAQFYPAEPYHQGYYRGHENQPYCAFVVAPKLGKFRQRFARLLK
ncbi:peptide-methionine (S)-S-oxide reductase MsrA [Niveibacterium sp. 24ML]|uniref:peptide-methionine (S)-S-oxide reductase MsrA n=1 Tax=Niveibacterium sp. 24ML TaxID=2985512 RepID=UPI00226EC5C2|nr:peptide-methionine (S)-S-oxide reductase MsrA [Niveibacterium sp. 24ML]MCX9158230.1 peptide-methionine (S)-S-oxide reductase MsrA [Niveibacterium sp. 24ML]